MFYIRCFPDNALSDTTTPMKSHSRKGSLSATLSKGIREVCNIIYSSELVGIAFIGL